MTASETPGASGRPASQPPHPQSTTVLVLGVVGLVAPVVAPFALRLANRVLRDIDGQPGASPDRDRVVAARWCALVGSAVLGAVVAVVGSVAVVRVLDLSLLTGEQYRLLLRGARVTAQVTALAVAWGTVVAIVLGVLGQLRPPERGGLPIVALVWLVRGAVRVYVEVIRGVSAIILLVWIYYALPLFGLELSAMQAGVLALGLNLSAYGTEIVRGAVQAVPRGQAEAAVSINLSGRQRLWSITLPQAMVGMLPPYGNLLIEVMKASSLVYLISLADITQQARNLRQLRAAESIDIFAAVLVLYFLIALVITAVIRILERVFGRGLDTGPGATAVGAAK